MGMEIYPTVHVGFNNPHWNLFLPSTQSSNFNTQQKCLFCIILLKPIFFSKPNIYIYICMCYLQGFFSANLVAPQTESRSPLMHWDPLGSPYARSKSQAAKRSTIQVWGGPGWLGEWDAGGITESGELTGIPPLGKPENHRLKIVKSENLYL